MFANVLRIKEVLKSNGYSFEWLANQLNISRQSLYSRLRTCKIDTLKEISDITNIPIHELIETQEGYAHFYDSKGVWQGIRKL